jgi:hypothetical protein
MGAGNASITLADDRIPEFNSQPEYTMSIPRSSRRIHRLAGIAGFAAAAICTAVPALAQGGSCAPIFAAQLKLLDTPHHAISIDSAGTDKELHNGKPQSVEMVQIGGTTYILYKGKWMKSPLTVDAMKKQEAENIKNSKSACAFVRNETVNGESAALYTIHSVNDAATSDGQEWISKSRGVPVRTAVTIDTGGGATGKRHTVTNFDYSNVQKPAGVN